MNKNKEGNHHSHLLELIYWSLVFSSVSLTVWLGSTTLSKWLAKVEKHHGSEKGSKS